jgi:hypothetical protein
VSRQAGLTRAALVALLAAVGLAAAVVATWRARSAPHTATGAGSAAGAGTGTGPATRPPSAATAAAGPAASSADAGAGGAAQPGTDSAADAGAEEVVELDKEVDGEPVIQEGRFAGWPRSQWRDYYAERLTAMRQDLAAARAILARADAGEPVDRDELAQARVRARDLELRIRFDENDLREVERAK